jgi:ATP citrate (pro-S)-lyase
MNILEQIRNGEDGILVLGNHAGIVQSILDFDFLSGKQAPSVLGIITANRKAQKFFFGESEILIPCFKNVVSVPEKYATKVRWMLNVQSGRRAFDSTVSFFEKFPEALGGHIFAENVPEVHAAELIKRFGSTKLIAGSSGVGLLIPDYLKLGAIGGTNLTQIEQGKLATAGSVAVIATSGGMTNELITSVAKADKRVSFALAIGGDRFPITSITGAFLLAETDSQTTSVVYFGELGGVDEYEIVELRKAGKLTKPIVAYIAGIIDEAFSEHVQFGHAKSLVAHKDESARAKRFALRASGVQAPESFPDFLEEIARLPQRDFHDTVIDIKPLMDRQKSILSTREIFDTESIPSFVRDGELVARTENAFSVATLKALLGRPVSKNTAAFVEAAFELLLDHGGQVSGAVNTMVTARAGKDLVSSLASGLLTIGPRFGGAMNDAAQNWMQGVTNSESAAEFVEKKAKAGELLAGIGHLKYRIGIPDPRVAVLAEFATLLKQHGHYDFAREVESLTTTKNGSLILNVDGVIPALLLDILSECDGFTKTELQELIDAEFFNAMFVIPRTVGFIAHFMEQKKNDEGLFRLPDELLFVRKQD